MADVNDYINGEMARFKDELFEFLRIPSVSARSEHAGDIKEAASWVADRMRDAGLSASVIETPGHPVVLGEWKEAGPDAPTLLIYGHYDVQPPEPLDLWVSPAFEPTVRDGNLFARGASDDKGQLFLHIKALEAQLKGSGNLPVNVVVVAEGEEEVGSPNLVPFVESHRDRLACDAVVISDSSMFAQGIPSLLFSLRGLAYFEIHVQGPAGDLHSGSYGGAVVNPGNVLAQLLDSLKNSDGSIAIPGFYDDVMDWDEKTREAIRGLPFDQAEFEGEVRAPGLNGEAGFSLLERLWIRPTCDVNGILCGYTGEGAKTVLPAKAMAKVSFRLVPNQDPERVGELLKAHLDRIVPPEVEVTVEELHGGRPWKAELEGPFFEAARNALAKAFGTDPVLTGEGGSIPIVVDFQEILEAPVLLMGFAPPGANMHAPNEWIPLENFENGIRAVAQFYAELGG
ncbi:MAG: dipeptidase [Gemmatimonadetes bacterium]|nr:dipeptidase [Gemmatimonadota bacterium]NNM07280.1 dipeptidase [Gemmatimonadota bacterium]